MKLRRFADPEAFLKAGRAHLLAEEARTGLLHGIVQQLARGAHRREEAYLALLEDGGEVVGAAVRTPPWKLVLGPMSDGQARQATTIGGAKRGGAGGGGFSFPELTDPEVEAHAAYLSHATRS